MKRKIIPILLFLVSFSFGFFFIDRTAQAQGVASAVSLWLGSSYVSSSNPLPVHNQ